MFDGGNVNCHGNSTVIFERMVEKRFFSAWKSLLLLHIFPLGT